LAGGRSDHHDNAWSLPSLHDDGWRMRRRAPGAADGPPRLDPRAPARGANAWSLPPLHDDGWTMRRRAPGAAAGPRGLTVGRPGADCRWGRADWPAMRVAVVVGAEGGRLLQAL